jgi:hypothetical protein
MSYFDIFVLGWNLNVVMFVINFLLVLKIIKTHQRDDLLKQSEVLNNLKKEFDQYYPYRKYSTLATYLFPFAAFFRMTYRLLEMASFFMKNSNTTMYDYMLYKYQNDINLAKNR